MRMACAALLLLGAAGLGSCARIAVHYESREALQRRGGVIATRVTPEESAPIITEGRRLPARSHTVALFGLKAFSDPVDLTDECPEGWGEFTTYTTGLQALLHVVTLNLYSPWTVQPACRATVVRPSSL